MARLTREVELLHAEVAAQQLALASLGNERDAARAGGFETQDRLKVRPNASCMAADAAVVCIMMGEC